MAQVHGAREGADRRAVVDLHGVALAAVMVLAMAARGTPARQTAVYGTAVPRGGSLPQAAPPEPAPGARRSSGLEIAAQIAGILSLVVSIAALVLTAKRRLPTQRTLIPLPHKLSGSCRTAAHRLVRPGRQSSRRRLSACAFSWVKAAGFWSGAAACLAGFGRGRVG